MKTTSTVEKTTTGGWYTIKEKKRLVTYSFVAKGNIYTGRATCSPEDTFDVEKGKRIAKLRAILALKKDGLRELRTDLTIAQNVLTPASVKAIEGPLNEKIEVYAVSVQNLEKKIAEQLG